MNLFETLRALQLPLNDFAIFGSGPMVAHGLIDSPHDLDIVARGAAWERATSFATPQVTKLGTGQVVYFDNGNIEVFNQWGPGEWDIDALIARAEEFAGIRFVSLADVLAWKKLMGRPKDVMHIRLIEEHLPQCACKRGAEAEFIAAAPVPEPEDHAAGQEEEE